jgi:copper resistance protein C
MQATLAALLLALAGAGATLAHAELVESDPADGAVLDTSPTTITLTFSENLDPAKSSFRLLGPDGALIGTGDATAAKAMTLESSPLADGTYTIKWTSASADDGDIERGQFTFTVQLAAASNSPSAPPTASAAASASAPASTAPSVAAPSTVPSAVAPTPAPSAAPTTPASSTSDVLLPIVIGLLIVAGVGVFVLRRSRGA